MQLRRRVQLQGNARERLLNRVVEFLRQARSFRQNGFELTSDSFGRNFKLQLLRSLIDPFFKLVVGLLQRQLRFFAFSDQKIQSGIFPRNHYGPAHNHNQHKQTITKPIRRR